MKFTFTVDSTEFRLNLGIEEETKTYFLSIPVSNPLVDYLEFYSISEEEYERFRNDLKEANRFAERCRQRMEDHRLLQKPGSMRGIPT